MKLTDEKIESLKSQLSPFSVRQLVNNPDALRTCVLIELSEIGTLIRAQYGLGKLELV